ncbi:MAG: hypothetical protein ACK5QX_12495, partial [bacterium]
MEEKCSGPWDVRRGYSASESLGAKRRRVPAFGMHIELPLVAESVSSRLFPRADTQQGAGRSAAAH